MSNKNIDELLKGLSANNNSVEKVEHSSTIYEKKDNEAITAERKKKGVIIAICSTLLIAIFTAFSFISSQKQNQQREADRIKASEQSVSKSIEQREASEKEKKFVLSKEEYEENITLLSSSDIGLKRDEKKGLVGTLTFGDGKTEEVLSYNRKDGSLHCLDSEENAVTHNSKWVRALIEKIKAKEKNYPNNTPSNG
jgi:hypothetical protein